jgi:hypothetical protein
LLLPAQQIPPGTALPVMLRSTLDSRHSKPGQMVKGQIKQDIRLPDGMIIRAGARVTGHVVSATPAAKGSPSRLAVKFDRISMKGRQFTMVTHLRALASMMEVFDAKLPTNSIDDYGTTFSDWTTTQVGGAGAFRGSGNVIADGAIVGRTTDYGAVTAKLIPAPARGCDSDGEQEQALWVFSPSVCGVYGFADLKIAHWGRTTPLGEIAFQSSRNVHIRGGSGWLLQVEAGGGGKTTSQP